MNVRDETCHDIHKSAALRYAPLCIVTRLISDIHFHITGPKLTINFLKISSKILHNVTTPGDFLKSFNDSKMFISTKISLRQAQNSFPFSDSYKSKKSYDNFNSSIFAPFLDFFPSFGLPFVDRVDGTDASMKITYFIVISWFFIQF